MTDAAGRAAELEARAERAEQECHALRHALAKATRAVRAALDLIAALDPPKKDDP